MKILFVATVQSHICQFHLPIMGMLREKGYEVHVAARDNLEEKNGLQMKNADKVFNIPFERSPFNSKNIKAYKELRRIMKEENYDIVHCNTPVGGILTRLAGRKLRKNGLRVIYTAHGFHFYKGAPKKNWIIYYPIEKFMSRYTDDLITITEEDYNLAKTKGFKGNIHHVHGVGVNSSKFVKLSEEDRQEIRKSKGYNDEFIILCTGELNKNKNQATLIRAMSEIVKKHDNVRLLLAGNGPEHDNLVGLINELDLGMYVELLGYRTDLEDYVNICDLVVSASYREGLPLNIMEAMICGKPVVASYNRGHRELIKDNQNGILVDLNKDGGFTDSISLLIENQEVRDRFSINGMRMVEPFKVENVKGELVRIYDGEDI